MTMASPALVERKSKCFSSSWWPVTREPAVLDEDGELVRHGRPIRFVLLDGPELAVLGAHGQVDVPDFGTVTL